MVEGDFDRWTLANMNAALDEVRRKMPRGEEHAVRKRIAKHIIKCARSGRTTFDELTAAGLLAASRDATNFSEQITHRECRIARSA